MGYKLQGRDPIVLEAIFIRRFASKAANLWLLSPVTAIH